MRPFTAMVAAAALGLFCASAQAADPDAPLGAPASWLPKATWVQDHWLPYSEARLDQILGMSHDQILQWLRQHNDHASLATLARERGVRVNGLAGSLVGARPRWMSTSLYRLLIYRAGKTLTQPHLMRHMLGHLMHLQVLLDAMPGIFGYRIEEITQLRAHGLSFDQIGARHGHRESTLRREVLAVLGRTEHHAVTLHQTPAAQAQYWLALQERNLRSWLESGIPGRGTVGTAVRGIEYLCHPLI